MSIDVAEFDKFVHCFHRLAWIDRLKTHPALIEKMKAVAVDGVNSHYVPLRGSGVTTFITQFCLFFESVPKLLLVSSGAAKRYEVLLKNTNTHISAWRLPFAGLRPRPEFCLVDDPLSMHEIRSPSTCANFNHVLEKIEIPKLVVSSMQ